MKTLTAALLVTLSLSPGTSQEPLDPPPIQVAGEYFDEYGREIFFAVLRGLYEDGVLSEVVDSVLRTQAGRAEPEHFVWCCPICMPALEAFRLYRERPRFVCLKVGDTFGHGLAPEVKAALLSDDFETRQQTLDSVIHSWMTRHLERLRLDEQEEQRWLRVLEDRRKRGMTFLESYRGTGSYEEMERCALCDGAANAADRC